MVGRDIPLPQGYRGLVLGKLHQQTGFLSSELELEGLATFDKVTEWKKDAWTAERGFAENLRDYLECAQVLHAE